MVAKKCGSTDADDVMTTEVINDVMFKYQERGFSKKNAALPKKEHFTAGFHESFYCDVAFLSFFKQK